MAFDISRFVTPEQQFKGLEQLGETLAAQQAAKAKAAEADKARRAGLETQLGGLIKPGDFTTETVNDPYFTKNVYDILEKGQQLIKTPGMDWSTLNSSLIPYVSQLAQSRDKVKQVKRQIEQGAEVLKNNKGVDLQKYYDNAYKRAFYTTDENGNMVLKNTVDMSQIDPNHNYADDVLKEDDIYTAAAIQEHLKDVGNVEYAHTQVSRGRSGKETSTTYDVKSNPDFQPIVDEKTGRPTGAFEPKYQVFKDGDQVQMHTWLGDKGEEMKAPIKLLDENAYNRLLNSSNSAAPALIRSRTRQIANQYGIDLTSPQAEYLSRAIAYDYYKDNMPKDASIKLKEGQKFPVTRVSVSVGGKDGGEAPYNPIYQKLVTIGADLLDNKKNYFVPINKLPGDVANALIQSYAAAAGKDAKTVKTSEFAVNRLPNGEWGLFAAEGGKPIGNVLKTLSEDELNIGAAKGKGERAAILKTEIKTTPVQKYKLSNGKVLTYNDLIKAGYNDENIKTAISLGNAKPIK